MRNTIAHLCMLSVGLNTGMFAYNLFSDMHQFALFNLLCAGGCWIGYYKFKNGDENGN
jgi:hypothetical protein